MILKIINGLNITVDNRMELIFAIHALYKDYKQNEDLDWIETPPIEYFNDLKKLIDIKKYPKLCKYIEYAFEDCAMPANLASYFDKEFNLQIDNINNKVIFSYGNIEEFAKLFKEVAEDIKWNEFLELKKDFYQNILKEINIVDSLNIDEIEKFYGTKKNSYTYNISVLINGGFAVHDNYDNIYAIRGFIWDDEEYTWLNDKTYLFENMFHEFSHSFINQLVDKYELELSKLKPEDLSYNINKTYGMKLKTILYEYFVRANATILASKYTHDLKATEYIKSHGFPHLQEIIDFTLENKNKYFNYEEFFVKELIPFMYTLSNSYSFDEDTKSIKA